MQSVILVIHLIVALAIIAIVLVQPSETGGFLGSGGSMSNMMAPRRQGDVLTRLTMIFAGIFFVTSLSLALYAEHRGPSRSILDVPTDAAVKSAPAAPAVKTDNSVPAPDASALKKVAPEEKKDEKKPAAKKKPSAPISK